jgi:hypothetical protein
MGISFGGIMKSLVNPMSLMQLAMGPAGWASLAVKTIGTAIAQQLIQKLGQELGLPPSIIGLVQQAFAGATGSQGMPSTVRGAVDLLAQQFNLSPKQQGELMRGGNKAYDALLNDMLRQIKDFGKNAEGKKEGFDDLSTSNGKKGFLYKIADALGKSIDQQMTNMEKLADKIKTQTAENQTGVDNMSDEPNGKETSQASLNGQKLGSLNSELQAASQQMGILSQVVSSVLKSVGEAQSTVARKG